MTIKKLFLLIISLGCCTAAAMDSKRVPLDIKKTILQNVFKGESLATIVRRMASWRTVSKEWNKVLSNVLSNEQFLEKVFGDSTFVRENDLTPVVHKYFARYLAQIVARGALSPMEEKLLALVLKEDDVFCSIEVFKLLCTCYEDSEHSEETSKNDELTLYTYSLLLHIGVTKFEGGPPSEVNLALLTQKAVDCYQRCRKDLWEIVCLARRMANDTGNQKCLIVISMLTSFIENSDKSHISYGDIVNKLGSIISISSDPFWLKTLLNSDTAIFIETMQKAYVFNEQEKAFLLGAVKGDCISLMLKSAEKSKPVLVDLALAIALKAGHEEYVLKLLNEKLKKRPMMALLFGIINSGLAVRSSEKILLAIGDYYNDSFTLPPNGLGSLIMPVCMTCVRSSEEIEQLFALLERCFDSLDLIHKNWLLACYRNDIEQMRTILKSEEGFTGQMKSIMVGTGISLAITHKRYDILKMLLEDEALRVVLKASLPILKPIIDKDPKLQELFSSFK